uniref:Uncharacterized protein n=1 Tax=Talaromyces marneffei PM1 TaxID=1077442 RepID=A0A093UQA8_TALMA
MLLFIFAWVILTATTYCQTEASVDNASLAVAPKLPFPCISKFGLKDCKDGTPNCCGGNCVNTQTDETNCGTCGHHCTAAAPECCGGTCTDTQTDALNCGMCGHAIYRQILRTVERVELLVPALHRTVVVERVQIYRQIKRTVEHAEMLGTCSCTGTQGHFFCQFPLPNGQCCNGATSQKCTGQGCCPPGRTCPNDNTVPAADKTCCASSTQCVQIGMTFQCQ